jgi:hypothetical protein
MPRVRLVALRGLLAVIAHAPSLRRPYRRLPPPTRRAIPRRSHLRAVRDQRPPPHGVVRQPRGER